MASGLREYEQVQSWFEAYLATPIVITMFLVFKIIKKTRFRRLLEIDIDSGKRELDLPAILAEERGGAGKVANVEEDLEDGLLDTWHFFIGKYSYQRGATWVGLTTSGTAFN